jgi:hypothetical protein
LPLQSKRVGGQCSTFETFQTSSKKLRSRNQEIAEILHITAGTVRVHVHAILNRLNVSDRTQAATLAIQKKFIAKDLLSDL